jgi:hypothetical protein
MVTQEDLYDAVDEMSLEELRDLNEHVIELMRARRNATQSEKMPRFSEGETVNVVEEGEITFSGTITRKKRTHVLIDTGDTTYDVPILLVEKRDD